jgi:hypothetical protein
MDCPQKIAIRKEIYSSHACIRALPRFDSTSTIINEICNGIAAGSKERITVERLRSIADKPNSWCCLRVEIMTTHNKIEEQKY